MARAKKAAKNGNPTKNNQNGSNLGFEAKLWAAADALRSNMDAAEYKHVALGLIFLKYISDAFEAKHAELEADRKSGADPEDPDEYRAARIFWVPKEARWSRLKVNARLVPGSSDGMFTQSEEHKEDRKALQSALV